MQAQKTKFFFPTGNLGERKYASSCKSHGKSKYLLSQQLVKPFYCCLHSVTNDFQLCKLLVQDV